MKRLDPRVLFERIAADVPQELHQSLFVTGSLAVAYEFQAQLEGGAVNTKDADVVVHPAGNVDDCGRMAAALLALQWTRHEECYPRATPDPSDELRAIRLYPPDSRDYFIEFLNLPRPGQSKPRDWIPVELDDGWYGLPTFRFLGVTNLHRRRSHAGIEYASPSMMALANLLAHPSVGNERIESGRFEGSLRSAKDLGRVIALARLAGRDQTEAWLPEWLAALTTCFPDDWRTLAVRAGNGLKDLLADDNALEDARTTTDVGLLAGMNVTATMLRATGDRLLLDVVEPLADRATSR